MSLKEPSFEQAMNASIYWCKAWESGELSDEVLADRVGDLLATRDGARGFFVIGLGSDFAILDRLPDALLIELRFAGPPIVDLTVRNLAMSSAMSVHHQRNSDANQQRGSERVKARCIEILRQLEPNSVKTRLEKLLEATKGKGEDISFLDHWGYDKEQIVAIANSINSIADK